VRTECIESNSL